MGISFNPGGVSWSHGEYGELRRKLAALEGIDDIEAWWKDPFRAESPTALVPLLDAEDVHGFISGPSCREMVPRLKAIVKFNGDYLGQSDCVRLTSLIAAMEHCAQHGCALAFG